MRSFIYRKIKFASLSFGFLVLALIAIPSKAHAINNITIQNTAPVFYSANTDSAKPTSYTPWLAVGVGAYNGPYSFAKVYTTQDSTLTISQSNCTMDVGAPDVTYTAYRMKTTFTNGIPINEKIVSKAGQIEEGPNTCKSSSDQSATKDFTIKLNNGIASQLPGHEGWSTFIVQAYLVGDNPGSNERSFKLSVDNGGMVGLSRPDICGTTLSPCNPSSKNPDGFFGIYSRNLGPKTAFPVQADEWDYALQFAPRCGEATGDTKVRFYDLDPGVYSPQHLDAKIQADDRLDDTYSWNTIAENPPPPFQSGSGNYDNEGFASDLTHRYRLVLSGANWQNTIQVSLPFDEFDAQHSVGSECVSDFVCTATPVTGSATEVNVALTNNSLYKIGKGFQLRQTPTTGLAWPSDAEGGFADFIPGQTRQSQNHSPPLFTRPANTTEYYTLYDGTGNNAQPVGNVPLCSTAGTVSATCNNSSISATPGVPFDDKVIMAVTNTTGQTYRNTDGYHIKATPDGLGVTGNTQNVAVAIPFLGGPNGVSATFSFTANYQGTFTLVMMNPQNIVISTPNPCTVTVIPQVAPYFQVWQNDAAGGGAFNSGNTCNITYPNYVSPATASGANKSYFGGIRAMSGSTYQSKSDFGAVALGLIPDASGGEGFSVRNNAYFANTGQPSGSQGGFLNSNSANHCVTDYYGTTKIGTQTTLNIGDDLNTAINDHNRCRFDTETNSYRCQFQAGDGYSINNPVNIPDNYQVTVYVSGDVTISSNITYAGSYNPNDRANIPYFALIAKADPAGSAKGDIILTNNVTRLDGLYVAQPKIDVSGNTIIGTGKFETCDSPDLQSISQCTNQLTVNGAVIAQSVELLRTHGSSQPLGTDKNGIGNAPAEIINFTPSMILGAPALGPLVNTSGLFSLPPVF